MNCAKDKRETTGPQDHRTTGLRTTHHGPRTIDRRSRFTFYALRFTAPAFTLIELLVVISIIALLAAMTIPITRAVNKAKVLGRAKGERALIEQAIEAYKSKYGVYPPDNVNPGDPAVNQLFYELLGTTNNGIAYITLDGGTTFLNTPATFQAAFGSSPVTTVGGFINCSKGGGGDETKAAKNFLPNLKPGQYKVLSACTVLGCSLQGPANNADPTGRFNPWRYVSSGPTNNAGTYDLWIDVLVGDKTNRICNWRTEAFVP